MPLRTAAFIYRFKLAKPGQSPELLQTLLTLALKETELVFGKAKLKLETTYQITPKRPVCYVEGGTECGEHLAKLLAGFLIKQVGEQGFRVQRVLLKKGNPT